jgi:hypothetical protein
LCTTVCVLAWCPCGCRAYFISDECPMNNFEFVERALGAGRCFLFHVPASAAYAFALLCEGLYRALAALPAGPWSRWEFDLALTRAEVCKVCVGVVARAQPSVAQLCARPSTALVRNGLLLCAAGTAASLQLHRRKNRSCCMGVLPVFP